LLSRPVAYTARPGRRRAKKLIEHPLSSGAGQRPVLHSGQHLPGLHKRTECTEWQGRGRHCGSHHDCRRAVFDSPLPLTRARHFEGCVVRSQCRTQPEAQARQGDTQRRQAAALRAWNPSDKPDWLNEKYYRERIQSRLPAIHVPTIQSALSVSEPYALRIRSGGCIPHRRHWSTLAELTGYQKRAD
jgi:hypothetical protein